MLFIRTYYWEILISHRRGTVYTVRILCTYCHDEPAGAGDVRPSVRPYVRTRGAERTTRNTTQNAAQLTAEA